ncbi:MAG: GNAT family N-acetyltransferase [Ilumatobacteraceae bacterium]
MDGIEGDAVAANRFDFRPLARDDFPMLGDWLGRAHVRAWWHHDPSPASIDEDFGPGVDGDEAVEVLHRVDRRRGVRVRPELPTPRRGRVVGALQVVDAPRDAFTMDYFIAEPSLVGQGLGTAMIGEFLEDRWRRYPDATCSIVDVDPANPPSWRALEKNGYRTVWEGELDVSDLRDQGTSRVYRLERPPDWRAAGAAPRWWCCSPSSSVR